MTQPKCQACKRAMKHPTPSGYGPVCARKRGLIPRKPRRTRTVRVLKLATVPPAVDEIPGQIAIDLVFHQPTLESL